jgi:hypothetical protein
MEIVMNGVMNMPEVKCAVSNCEYWNSGNNCGADAIMVDIDQHARARYDTEIAGEFVDTDHQDVATSSKQTCCHTFKPKTKA